MAADPGLIESAKEALEPLGSITHRRMFGGAALYCDGTAFAIVAFDALWFKGDAETDTIWDAQGCERFTVEMQGRTASMNYRRAPDDVYDDADAMREWARLGIAAGLRAPKKKPKRSKSNG
jgi:DNA transformation protein and related proteins